MPALIKRYVCLASLALAGTARALQQIGATAIGSTPAEFDAFMHAEVKKWEPVLKAANIRAQ